MVATIGPINGQSTRPKMRCVSITEMAFYQALEWQDRVGGGRTGTPIPLLKPAPPTYPFESSHSLWCFTLTAPPSVIEVDDPIAYATFQHAPIEILNPGQAYETTQSLGDRIRSFTHIQRTNLRELKRLPSEHRLWVVNNPLNTHYSS